MSRHLYLNLPVRDLARSQSFFQALGFSLNPQFSDAEVRCLTLAHNIHLMLLCHSRYQQYSPLPIADSQQQSAALFCLSCDSREEVDDLVQRALAAGGSLYNEAQDHGFMYGHGFRDLDGQIWELVYMHGIEPGED